MPDTLSLPKPPAQPAFIRRPGQVEFMRGVLEHRICGLITRRQYGKTTVAADISIFKMMAVRGHNVIFGSVKLDLGREMTRKEAQQLQKGFAIQAARVAAAKMRLESTDDRGHNLDGIKEYDWAELYESSKLEFRLWHDRTTYSRTKVVALTPEAVGETGDLILDEVGRVRKFRDVWEAVKPIISSNPSFRCLLTTTPPPDDAHYSFELLAPPPGFDPPPEPKGHWYKSELNVWVLRVTAEDAFAGGVPLYDDDTGEALSPSQARQRDPDKDAFDRNYGCKFVFGGTAACSLLWLESAQTRGAGQCQFFRIDDESDMDVALRWLSAHLGPGRVGTGLDIATTTKATSNPSAFAVCEEDGSDTIVRAVFIWKTADDLIQIERVRSILRAIKARKEGGRARQLNIDATNERLFAARAARELRGECPIQLVVASETIQIAGQPDRITRKQALDGRLVRRLNDNKLTLPPDRYIREDWRLVRKERGLFTCEPDHTGKHGDTFDATKHGEDALHGFGGPVSAEAVAVGATPEKPGQDFNRPVHDDDRGRKPETVYV
ncbi:MAG: hypothetical protein HZA88_16580 [Verrucomicrobia bacterium]|nr:hypothetical protein [Verrucomicrobiota bacterium]